VARDFVTITFIQNRKAPVGPADADSTPLGPYQLKVTGNHFLKVERRLGLARHWVPACAAEVCIGDMLRTARGNRATVIDVECYTEEAEVVEVALSERKSTVFICTSANKDDGLDAFVEAYAGDFAPSDSQSHVEILSYKWRPKKFMEILSESAMLKSCRTGLRTINLSMDLTEAGLGPGKLVVSPKIATRVLAALRCRRQALRASDIVVSAEFKVAVMQLMEAHARKQDVGIEALELPHKLKVKNTFWDNVDEESVSLHTWSTPNANAWNPSRNPHAKASLQRARPAQSSHQNL